MHNHANRPAIDRMAVPRGEWRCCVRAQYPNIRWPNDRVMGGENYAFRFISIRWFRN